MRVALGIILGLVGILPFSAQEPSAAEGLGFSPDPTESLTRLVEGRVAEGVAPGAVVLVGRGAGIASAVVVGDRSRQPETHALTRDTIFDLASLTKVLATTLSVMRLVEEGQVALEDPVIKYLPEFRGKGKEAITVESLLRHRGGLLPDNALADYAEGTQRAWERICALGLRADPDTHYIYTDVGFIVLGRLVEAVSGKPLDVYARDHVFLPLGMKDTRFVRKGIAVASSWRDRVAPTEPAPGAALPLQAVVHDPRARAMDGVAGHAGLFAPADDVARAAMMLARRGRLESGEAFLSEATWRLMVTAPEDLSDAERRGLGWDLRPAGESGHRPGGLLFPADGFGHTGFTGTSLWVDPRTETWIVILASRLHAGGGRASMSTLRQGVADLVATCLDDRPWNTPDDLAKGVFTGLERLAQGYWPRRWMGRRVGLVTNHTGRTTDGRSAASVLASHDHVVLAALFSPEHGLYGTVDEKVGHAVDAETGLRVWSLYGEVRKPSKEMLEGLDILVFDIQDIGTRFYTYLSTLTNCMEAAHENGLAVCVLDRPNPIGGVDVEGPLADAASLDFVGIHPLPIRHGMTMGELALMIAAERGWTIELEVVWMKGWQRRMLFDETGIAWVDPSPNMRSLEAALIYPGLGILETTNLSVGRGTDSPFEIVGAPWFPADAVKTRLDAAGLPGVAFEPVVFRPSASKFRGERCRGLRLSVLDRATFRPVAMAMTLAVALRTEAPEAWDRGRLDRLLKSKAVLASVEQSVWPTVPDSETPASFALRRARFLSYD